MFKLTMKTDNAAFCDDSAPDDERDDDSARHAEVSRILHRIAKHVANGYTEGAVMDVNGNRVGWYEFTDE